MLRTAWLGAGVLLGSAVVLIAVGLIRQESSVLYLGLFALVGLAIAGFARLPAGSANRGSGGRSAATGASDPFGRDPVVAGAQQPGRPGGGDGQPSATDARIRALLRLDAPLDRETALLALASTFAAQGEPARDDLAAVVRIYAVDRFDLDRMREALLQTYLFGGFPTALNALTVFRAAAQSVAPHKLARLRNVILEDASPRHADRWEERGTHLARRVYGGNFDKLVANAHALSPDLAQWMLMEGYGRVLSRSILPFEIREPCIVATLVPLGAPRQLFSHMRGCLNIGLRAEAVEGLLRLVEEVVSHTDAMLMWTTWDEVVRRRQ
jgi:alkylhydroperoxidase/carboxymuconolactone decarboxylase family protein YurZ